jgi:hypothetical protein
LLLLLISPILVYLRLLWCFSPPPCSLRWFAFPFISAFLLSGFEDIFLQISNSFNESFAFPTSALPLWFALSAGPLLYLVLFIPLIIPSFIINF